MAKRKYPPPPIPNSKSLKTLSRASQSCKACALYKRATQAVFGQGSPEASLLIVGEQPGHQEDLQGLPFVGPAGDLLRHCIQEAGLTEGDIYFTNAVKHFKWVPVGKRRLHQKPNRFEVEACRPWLEKQVDVIKPKVILALGVTAAQSILGHAVLLGETRGKIIGDSPLSATVIISWHPSAILRSIDRKDADAKRKQLIYDIKLAARAVKKQTSR